MDSKTFGRWGFFPGFFAITRRPSANLVDGDGCDSNCRVTACGNGIVTAGEECEDGNRLSNTDCCEANCQFRAFGRPCGDQSESDCDKPDSCDGQGHCLPNREPLGTPCRASGVLGACDTGDACDGQNLDCPSGGRERGCDADVPPESTRSVKFPCFAPSETVQGGVSTYEAVGYQALEAGAGTITAAAVPAGLGEQVTDRVRKKLKQRKDTSRRERQLKLRLNARGKGLLKAAGAAGLRVAVEVTIRHGNSTHVLQRLVTLLRRR